MEPFREAILLGSVSSELLDQGALAIQRLPHPRELEDEEGRIPVTNLVRLALRARKLAGLTLVLTDRDLAMPACRSLFGFADRRAKVAVISIARLGDAADPARLPARLRNEIAHEAGHLNGLCHCRGPACVMAPVKAPHELDHRPALPCGRCSRMRSGALRILGTALAAVFLVFVVLGIDRVASVAVGPPPDIPFT
jgi:hypothetical protein